MAKSLVLWIALLGIARADKFDDANRLARDEVAAASAKVSGRWVAGELWWDTAAKVTTASAQLVMPADPADPLADAPVFEGARFTLVVGPPAKLITHIDPAALRASAARADALGQTLELARAALKKEARYAGWKAEKWRYTTRLYWDRDNTWTVIFDPPGVTDSTISIVVDAAAGKVVSIRRAHA